MSGLFVLVFWSGAQKLGEKRVFASSIRGASVKATRLAESSPEFADSDSVVLYSYEHVQTRKRRFCFESEWISPWIDFDEAIDDV